MEKVVMIHVDFNLFINIFKERNSELVLTKIQDKYFWLDTFLETNLRKFKDLTLQ